MILEFSRVYLLLLWISGAQQLGERNIRSVVPENYRTCSSDSVCLTMENCQFWEDKYDSWKGDCSDHRQDSLGCRRRLKELRDGICNKDERAFCCPEKDEERVKEEEEKLNSPTFLPVGKDCGLNPEQAPRQIFGGGPTSPGDWPWAALVGVSAFKRSAYLCGGVPCPKVEHKKWVCGGTLINLWYVVTAAHCQNAPKLISAVRLGDWQIGGFGSGDKPDKNLPQYQEFNITPTDVIVHKGFGRVQQTWQNDIALIRLPSKVELNMGVQVACLPTQESEPARELRVRNLLEGLVGKNTTVVGWGYTCYKKNSLGQNTREFCNDSDVVPSRIQQFIEIPIVNDTDCLFSINSSMQFCAGASEKDTCKGDSGGGLFARDNQDRPGLEKPWFVLGIVSFGTSTCGIGYPGVYTRVSAYTRWIKNNLKP